MYVTEGKRLTPEQVLNYLNSQKWIVELAKKKSKTVPLETPESLLRKAADELSKINDALHRGYEVWAECTKYPSGNLDTGRHYYQIYYLSIKNRKPIKNHFWPILFMDYRKNGSGYWYNFSSGAIGMSRSLDATDHVFSILKGAGGYYCQL